MLCLDNSEFMRNGDYPPTRLDVQQEAANYIASLKSQANVENSIGVLTMAGKRVDVLLTPSNDLGKALKSLASIEPSGQCNFSAALKTAQLCLKNRLNKNQRQRIIIFVGSPISDSTRELQKLGKHLKKHNVAVDVVNFGHENTENENTEKLDVFIQAVSSDNNSKLVVVPPGPHNFVDMIISTIMADSAPAGGMAGLGDFGGVDAEMDPELALAIRMSLEEERERQERLQQAEAKSEEKPSSTAEPIVPISEESGMDLDIEDEELAKALAMSMEQYDDSGDAVMHEHETGAASIAESAAPENEQSVSEILKDREFMDDLLSELDVSKEDVDVDSILNSLDQPSDKKDESKDQQKE